jgi:transketolase
MTMEKTANPVQAYAKALLEVGGEDERIFCLTADLMHPFMIEDFALKYPDRFINVGVAEQNLMGIAAGMATCGKIPFVHTYTPFMTMRSCEQMRTDVCYPFLNVKMAGMCSGINMGVGGATHHSVEDIAILRAIPNMTLLSPADPIEIGRAVHAAAKHIGPTFIRFGRVPSPLVYEEGSDHPFIIGKSITLRDGRDVSLLATGLMVHRALGAAELLAKDGISARVINIHTIKPIDQSAIIKAAKETGAIVTAEEHNIMAGFGSAVAEVVVEECPVPMRRVGIEDTFCGLGPTEEMYQKWGLTAEKIAQAAREVLQVRSATKA